MSASVPPPSGLIRTSQLNRPLEVGATAGPATVGRTANGRNTSTSPPPLVETWAITSASGRSESATSTWLPAGTSIQRPRVLWTAYLRVTFPGANWLRTKKIGSSLPSSYSSGGITSTSGRQRSLKRLAGKKSGMGWRGRFRSPPSTTSPSRTIRHADWSLRRAVGIASRRTDRGPSHRSSWVSSAESRSAR